MWWALVTKAAWSADCAPVDLTQLEGDVAAATLLAIAEQPPVSHWTGRVDADLACLTGTITPSRAAALHRLKGLQAHRNGDVLGAVGTFQAARLADPTLPMLPLLAEGLAAAWATAASPPPPAAAPLPAGKGLSWRVDGHAMDVYNPSIPAVLQLSDAREQVLWTGWTPAGAGVPEEVMRQYTWQGTTGKPLLEYIATKLRPRPVVRVGGGGS